MGAGMIFVLRRVQEPLFINPQHTYSQNAPASVDEIPRVYFYGNPNLSLEQIEMKIIVFVPQNPDYERNQIVTEDPNEPFDVEEKPNLALFQGYLEEAILPKISEFHNREFKNLSEIDFRVYPDIVYGLRDGNYYEQDFLDVAAKTPLRFINHELHNRLFSSQGDLYNKGFVQGGDDTYEVIMIIYVANVPRVSFRDEILPLFAFTDDLESTRSFLVYYPLFKNYELTAAAIYHELLHVMGVPEQYDLFSSDVLQQVEARGDIMGIGASGFLLETYLGNDIKTNMGIELAEESS